LYGSELDAIYDRCDLGLEILAPRRKGIRLSASLKSREYIARGLPFVSACRLDICDLGFQEYLQIDDTENSVDIPCVVKYYQEFGKEREQRVALMREFAENCLGMGYAMKSVIEFFKDTKKE